MICICLRVCFVILFTCGPLSAPHSSSTNVTHGCICYVSHPVCLSAHPSSRCQTHFVEFGKKKNQPVRMLGFYFPLYHLEISQGRPGQGAIYSSVLAHIPSDSASSLWFTSSKKPPDTKEFPSLAEKGLDFIWGRLHNWLSNHLITCFYAMTILKKRSILSFNGFCDKTQESLTTAQLHCLLNKWPSINHDTLKSAQLLRVGRL